MIELNEDVLIDLLHTNAGKEALEWARIISNHNLDAVCRYPQVVVEKIISAQKYYVGTPDGKFITLDDFDEATRNAPKAYITINTLLGNDTAERMRFNEGKKHTPGLITAKGIQKIIDMVVLLFAASYDYDGKEINYTTARTCRQTEISAGHGVMDVFWSTTKATADEIFAMGYGDKNYLAVCTFKFDDDAVVLDMSRFGKDYLKPEEKEVLILPGNEYDAECIGKSDKFIGKDGKPALVYEVVVHGPDELSEYLDEDYEKCDEILFDEEMISRVRAFYEALNNNIGGEYPEEPAGYRRWKKAFKQCVYGNLGWIHNWF